MQLKYKKEKDDDEDREFDIYAELNRKQYNLILNDEAYLEIPRGVTMKNKKGSRSLLFSCPNKGLAKMICQGLDESGVSWQISYFQPKMKKNKNEKNIYRNSRYSSV